MRYIYFMLLGFLFSACQKEMLDPINKSKVMLLQIDYKTNVFEGAKEFSYFETDEYKEDLPVQLSTILPNPSGDFYVTYANDTIFKGVQINQGKGSRIYPDQMDNQIHYLVVENDVVKPEDSLFVLYNDDISISSVDLNKLWKSVSKVRTLNTYRNSNEQAKIGLFLFRPSFSSNVNGDWKWYFVIKN
jgi:hypothetical protein